MAGLGLRKCVYRVQDSTNFLDFFNIYLFIYLVCAVFPELTGVQIYTHVPFRLRPWEEVLRRASSVMGVWVAKFTHRETHRRIWIGSCQSAA